jgi:uncharacterized membrane protein
MANAKSKARTRAQQRARAQAKKAVARTAPSVRATPNSPAATRTSRLAAASVEVDSDAQELMEPVEERVSDGPPAWFGWTTFVLAILGLGISAYETYTHYTGTKLAFCPAGHGLFNCTAVTDSSQSMVFNVIPVAVLGLAFYVVAVPLFSPWAWRLKYPQVGLVRLVSTVIGMGFVMYLIFAEVYQIGQVCEYCTGVHIVTFLLFCMTVVAAAIWGLAARRES